jgi:hypothetical protein
MKRTLALIGIFFGANAFASLEIQMGYYSNRDWYFPNNKAVFRVRAISTNTVISYRCNYRDWITSNYKDCNYDTSFLGEYHSGYDGFCYAIEGKRCAIGEKIIEHEPNKMIEVIDPLWIYNFSNSGRVNTADGY